MNCVICVFGWGCVCYGGHYILDLRFFLFFLFSSPILSGRRVSRYCTDVAQRRSTKLCTMFDRLLDWYTIYTFRTLSPLMEFCQVQNSLCVQILRYPILAALLHVSRAADVSQTLRCGTRNGITELSLLVIFNRRRHLYSKRGHHVGRRPTF